MCGTAVHKPIAKPIIFENTAQKKGLVFTNQLVGMSHEKYFQKYSYVFESSEYQLRVFGKKYISRGLVFES
jgi:hypothetical protein